MVLSIATKLLDTQRHANLAQLFFIKRINNSKINNDITIPKATNIWIRLAVSAQSTKRRVGDIYVVVMLGQH